MSSLLALALICLQTTNAYATNITGTYQQYAAAVYTLVDTYNASNFFSNFTFFTGADPTEGYVSYQSESAAAAAGLINTNNDQVYMGVDYTTVNPPAGRASVRVSSNKGYTHGLFIADIAHMPGSICGVWPAYWLLGPDWPNYGEIDIIEGVNLAGTNSITLHTAAGCSINIAGSQNGSVLSNSNCNLNDAGTGCDVTTTTPIAYGSGFNSIGGGVYATLWESTGIYVWFFPRDSIPIDITLGIPTTGNWGPPVAAFNGGSTCNIDSFFSNETIVFDTTFCGTVSTISNRYIS